MYAISSTFGKNTRWSTFPTSEERDLAFEKLKQLASKSGCGPQCACFEDNGDSFRHCGGRVMSIVHDLKMED